LPCICKWEPN